MTEPDPQPTPVSELDIDLARHLTRTRHQQYVLLGLVVLILIVVGLLVGKQLATNIGGECQFFSSISDVPVFAEPNPPDQPAATSPAVTQIVAGARNAYIGLSCQPKLPPPSPALKILAQRYRVTLRT